MIFYITSMERRGDLFVNCVFRLMAAIKADKYCPPMTRSLRYNVCRLSLQKNVNRRVTRRVVFGI